MAHVKRHDYHILQPSLWPLIGAAGAFAMLFGAVTWMHGSGPWLFLIGFAGVLFPTSETALLTVSTIRDDLSDFVTFIPSRNVVETMVFKTRFYKSLRAAKVPHPSTFYPDEVSVQEMVQMIRFPVFIRPAESLPFHERFRRKGFVAHNVHDLQRYLQLAQRTGFQVLVQDVIPGVTADGYTFRGYLDQRSQLMVLIASQKIRQPSTFANTTVLVTVPRSHARGLDDTIISYFQRLRYTGLYGVEFKRDPRDNQLKILESYDELKQVIPIEILLCTVCIVEHKICSANIIVQTQTEGISIELIS